MNNLNKMKETNLKEARELIRKNLNPSIDIKNTEPEEKKVEEPPKDEEVSMLSNKGINKASRVIEEELKEPKIETINKAIKENKTSGYTLAIVVVIILLSLLIIQIWDRLKS